MKPPGGTTGEASVLGARWRALDRLHRRIEGSVDRRLHAELGLSLREFQALTVLQEGAAGAAGRLYLHDLAAEIGLSQSATSRLVTRLQDRGLITTATAARDRRSVDVHLTPAAVEALRRGTPLAEEAVRHTVRVLNAEGAGGAGGADRRLLAYLLEGADGRAGNDKALVRATADVADQSNSAPYAEANADKAFSSTGPEISAQSS
ncbi:MarR family winged helix-turn-helix transcriptional regulator [Streptomyces sp. KL116D]|uniref:MarR family winged helix-turn-helix transcriptional regulator n=1 Tax=Streptomyces sp. KL116D TaxID=3045152 RepID=UPI003557D462